MNIFEIIPERAFSVALSADILKLSSPESNVFGAYRKRDRAYVEVLT
ncbi:MAG: hypothetical protein KME31_15845 [Tolypothrix carrinoi HA7290-LM1]|jgi:hypothetical protein|nr:hypothetical protein [Tolypothrix carrinoi HA7290-LM1]